MEPAGDIAATESDSGALAPPLGAGSSARSPLTHPAPACKFPAQQARLLVVLEFSVSFVASLFAEFIANDRPLDGVLQGRILFPIFQDYPESQFGGFLARTDYRDPFIADEIKAHGWMI